MNVATCSRPRTETSLVAVHGLVVVGDQRGRLLGFPTANLVLTEVAGVADGVYAGVVRIEGADTHRAAISVGRRPTFYAERGMRLLEAHLLDFSGDLYGKSVEVDLQVRLRDQHRFESVDGLVAQLGRDVESVRALAQPGAATAQ